MNLTSCTNVWIATWSAWTVDMFLLMKFKSLMWSISFGLCWTSLKSVFVAVGLYPFGFMGVAAPNLNIYSAIRVKSMNLRDGGLVFASLKKCPFFFSSYFLLSPLVLKEFFFDDFLFFLSSFLRLWKDFFSG